MPAVIESTLYATPGGAVVPGSTQQNSRDDLRQGYQVVLHSVHVATTYSWSLSFASGSPGTTVPGTPFDGTDSSSALLAPEGSTSRDAKFNVDFEGSYLIRLVVDAGLPTEDTQFIRCRLLTLFGGLKMVAAGERRDELGVIPVDASPEGWANDQNANLQRISLLLRRVSTTGRVLYVDANRGRDSAADQDDYDNVFYIPGTESARSEETGIRLRAMSHGDFSSINEAIAYAGDAAARGEPAPSKTDPYFIFIRPGLYEEDLNLASFIHLVGEAEVVDARVSGSVSNGPVVKPVIIRTVNAGGTGTHTFNPQLGSSTAEVFLYNLHLEGTAVTTNPVFQQTSGLVGMTRCVVRQVGDSVTQGSAVQVLTANALYTPVLYAKDCQIITRATTATRAALQLDATNGLVILSQTTVDAQSCIAASVNATLYTSSQLVVQDGSVLNGQPPFTGYPSSLRVLHSNINSLSGDALTISPPGGVGVKSGDVVVELIHTNIIGPVRFKTSNAIGTTSLRLDSVSHTVSGGGQAILLPDAPGDLPNELKTNLRSESIRYVKGYIDPRDGLAGTATIPALNQVDEEDVQRILDLLWQGTFPVTGSPFFDLNSAYNGLSSLSPITVGVGLGRNIDAVGGAVQVQGATYPTGLEDHMKHGGLQVEGVLDIGGFINGVPGEFLWDVGGSEIHLNPDQAGVGPYVGLGRATFPADITTSDRGFPGGFVVAGGAQTQTGDNAYHLHLRTAFQRTANTGKAGNVYVGAGGINDSASLSDAGDVHLLGGANRNPAGAVGDVWLVPGINPTPAAGVVWVTGKETGGTPATLTPVNVYVAPAAGSILFSTPVGMEVITFAGGENIAAAITLIGTQARYIRAVNVGGKLVLRGEFGPAGDIRYIGDTTAGTINTSLGNYIVGSGAVFTAGTYGHKVSIDVPQNGRLRVNGDLEYTGALIPGGSGSYVNVTNAMSPYATVLGDNLIGCNTSAGVVQINLTAGAPDGTVFIIKHEAGHNYVTIVPQGGDTIDGLASYRHVGTSGAAVAAINASVTIYKAGTDWKIGSEYRPPHTRVRFVTASRVWPSLELYDTHCCTLVAGVDTVITLESTMPVGRVVTIKDEAGTANAIPSPGGQKIQVVDALGGLIDGAAALDITTGYGSVTLIKTSSGNWAII